ncbi:MAG: hypothetical protein KBC95_01730 [Candidatus Peribacteraceae bacterium]|nr:hypothetical protein [Candidatus Peribacteraceae bacterium]
MCSSSNCGGCKSVSVILAIVFALATVAAGIGLYNAHFVGGMQFGTVEGSLSIFALIASLMALKKALMSCCGCDDACGGACATGCGCGCGSCGCGEACSKEEMAAGCGCGGDHGHTH